MYWKFTSEIILTVTCINVFHRKIELDFLCKHVELNALPVTLLHIAVDQSTYDQW